MVDVETLDIWRLFNSALSMVAFGLALWVIRRYYSKWRVAERLRMQSLTMMCLVGAYGSAETILFPALTLRVPMVTVAMLWCICAHLVPAFDKWNKKRKAEHA